MGKIFRVVSTGKNDKRTFTAALDATDGDTLDIPEQELRLSIPGGRIELAEDSKNA